jgi:hypothetical protein
MLRRKKNIEREREKNKQTRWLIWSKFTKDINEKREICIRKWEIFKPIFSPPQHKLESSNFWLKHVKKDWIVQEKNQIRERVSAVLTIRNCIQNNNKKVFPVSM